MNRLLFCILAGMSGFAIAAGPARTVMVSMDDSMRFDPSQVEAHQGETVRFVLANHGKLPHEFVVGTRQQIDEHAEAMKDPHSHHVHAGINAVTLAPGGKGQLVMSFPKSEVLEMACLVPGHYEAGMRGTITVTSVVR